MTDRLARARRAAAELHFPLGEPADGYRIVDRLVVDAARERAALIAGLRAAPASIPPKYFYDALGCALFGAICELPEYYPTRTERAIFALNRDAIARTIGPGADLVDLGSGDSRKAESWFASLAPARYFAVDIAAGEIERSLARLAHAHPDIEMLGVVNDFAAGLDLRDLLGPRRAVFFYPGSSIGNFTPTEALAFLRSIRTHCDARAGSGLLIGVDMKKSPARLRAAYDDHLGVTALFNRNVLNHVNRVLGSGFDPADFAHVACYDAALGRVEMHLEATRSTVVDIDGVPRRFVAGERIHTENSYKYAIEEFDALLASAGFAFRQTWQDPARDFAVFWAA
jgi:dimethylhistidine N-methyltransferase